VKFINNSSGCLVPAVSRELSLSLLTLLVPASCVPSCSWQPGDRVEVLRPPVRSSQQAPARPPAKAEAHPHMAGSPTPEGGSERQGAVGWLLPSPSPGVPVPPAAAAPLAVAWAERGASPGRAPTPHLGVRLHPNPPVSLVEAAFVSASC